MSMFDNVESITLFAFFVELKEKKLNIANV